MKVLSIAFAAAIAFGSFALSNDAAAQSKSIRSSNNNATQIMGDTKVKVKANNITTSASGKNATAKSTVGGIGKSTQIMGDTTIKVKAGQVSTTASGKNATAKSNIGTIGVE